jgi:hypothetical protein
LQKQRQDYYACTGVEAFANQILEKCDNKSIKSESEKTKLFSDLNLMIKKCADAEAAAKQQAEADALAQKARDDALKASGLRTNIQNANAKVQSLKAVAIDRLSADAKADYQKKRIISDTVAGVILGTGGGFLANHIIKNNQLSSGFDSISCQIAGQPVADWGDQFRIGYNK